MLAQDQCALGVFRVKLQRAGVVLGGARVLVCGLRALCIGDQWRHAGEALGAGLAGGRARILRIDAVREIKRLRRKVLLPGAERPVAGVELRGKRRGRGLPPRREVAKPR